MATLTLPLVTSDDLFLFAQSHFSTSSSTTFATSFLTPPSEHTQSTSLDSPPPSQDLGLYPDGTPRTLTTEQIAMFRYSEIQSLLRLRRRNEKKRALAKERRLRERAIKEEAAAAQREAEEKAAAAGPCEEGEAGRRPSGGEEGRLQAALWASQHDWAKEGHLVQNGVPGLKDVEKHGMGVGAGVVVVKKAKGREVEKGLFRWPELGVEADVVMEDQSASVNAGTKKGKGKVKGKRKERAGSGGYGGSSGAGGGWGEISVGARDGGKEEEVELDY